MAAKQPTTTWYYVYLTGISNMRPVEVVRETKTMVVIQHKTFKLAAGDGLDGVHEPDWYEERVKKNSAAGRYFKDKGKAVRAVIAHNTERENRLVKDLAEVRRVLKKARSVLKDEGL